MAEIKKQRTINNEASFKGVGLHTGRKCTAKFIPAEENAGITFIRTDVTGRPSFKAHVENVVDVIRGTTIGNSDVRIYTIEHILSALNGLGIDNLTVELDDNEPPVGDGSAKQFFQILSDAGIKEQNAPKNFFSVSEPVEYASSQTLIRLEPGNGFEIECGIDYDHPALKSQQFTLRSRDEYQATIAPARTYCFDYEIEALKKKGLAKGGSLENAIVVGPAGIYNGQEALRFENEFVRHKILDLMGDLMLLGQPIQGRIVARRCGHGHNINFLRQLKKAAQTAAESPVH